LQTIIGIFLCARGRSRKNRKPVFQPPLFRWEAVALFRILLVVQHGLIMGNLAPDNFPTMAGGSRFYDRESLLPIVHGGTILLATIVLLPSSARDPESVRVKAVCARESKNFAVDFFPAVSVFLALRPDICCCKSFCWRNARLSLAIRGKFISSPSANLLDFALNFFRCCWNFAACASAARALWLRPRSGCSFWCVLPFISWPGHFHHQRRNRKTFNSFDLASSRSHDSKQRKLETICSAIVRRTFWNRRASVYRLAATVETTASHAPS